MRKRAIWSLRLRLCSGLRQSGVGFERVGAFWLVLEIRTLRRKRAYSDGALGDHL